jgi:tetratricopeptide (TPR) repeat protein
VEQTPDRVGPADEAAVQLGYGTLLRLRDRNLAAMPHLRRAYRLYCQAADNLGAASAAFARGIAAEMLGRPRVASSALSITSRLLALVAGPTPQHGYLHIAHYQFGTRFDMAELMRALDVFDALGESWGAAEAHVYAGGELGREGKTAEAFGHLRAAIESYSRLGDRVNLTLAELNMANTHLNAGETRLAAPILERTLRTFGELRHAWGEARSRYYLGRLHLDDQRPAEAVTYLEEAVVGMRNIGQAGSMAQALHLLARALLAVGDRTAAVRAGREALEYRHLLRPIEAGELANWLSTVE